MNINYTLIFWRVIKTVSVLIAAFLLYRMLLLYLKRVLRKIDAEKKYFKPLKNIVLLLDLVVIAFILLAIWGFKGTFTGLLASAGFAGIVIGFALQDIISNFLGGLILIFDPKFNVGDIVEIGNISGKIDNISFRTTTIISWDGELIIVPNSKIIKEVIKNKSLYKPKVRVRIPIGISYESNLQKAIKISLDVLKEFNEIEKDPNSQIAFDKFGDFSVNFEVRFWVNMEKVSIPEIKTKVSLRIRERFKEEGIEIPYPKIEMLSR